jgi:hypothetical protein
VKGRDETARRRQTLPHAFDAREFSEPAKFGRKRTEKNLAVASAVTAAIAAAIAAAPAATTVASTSAATAASTTATAVPAAITAAPASASTAPFSLRTSLIHYQRAAKEVFAVEGCNRLLRCAVVMNLGETETARLSGEAIA